MQSPATIAKPAPAWQHDAPTAEAWAYVPKALAVIKQWSEHGWTESYDLRQLAFSTRKHYMEELRLNMQDSHKLVS